MKFLAAFKAKGFKSINLLYFIPSAVFLIRLAFQKVFLDLPMTAARKHH